MDVASAIDEILSYDIISIDTETTGLRPFHGDEPFAIIIASHDKTWYFNLNEYPGVKPDEHIDSLKQVFESNQTKIFHNAKFDLHHLARAGFSVHGPKLDTWFLDRLFDNDNFAYDLSTVAKRRGFEKSKEVDEYIKKHKLSKKEFLEKYNKQVTHKYYAEVPLEIMKPYAERDARITFDIARKLTDEIAVMDGSSPTNKRKISEVIKNESRLIDTLYRMEKTGIQLDVAYCAEARVYYTGVIARAESEFKKMTGEEFVKGETVFKKVFESDKEKWQFTDKGNPRFDYDTLMTFSNPAAKLVCEYAEAKKQLEYFHNFLYEADPRGVIHCDLVQAGTVTGRFSSRNPNMQNLTNPDKYEGEADASKYPVRKSFIPRKGFFFAMLDYKQIEYRVMLDRARATSLVNKILAGYDVHEATSELAGVTRKEAKTVNFLTLYGGGRKKLAAALGKTEDEAAAIQASIFRAAPEIRDFIRTVIKTAEHRGHITNWLGRRYQFKNKDFCYKAPNHLIQGDCADILKVAMNQIDELLLSFKSRMILTIHDELIFEIAYGEEPLILSIKGIMERVFMWHRLPLLVDVEMSETNLADKKEYVLPNLEHVETARDPIQGARNPEAQEATPSVGV